MPQHTGEFFIPAGVACTPVVGADAHIGPAVCTDFTVFFGKFATSQWADDSVRPQKASVFTEICGESAAAKRVDVGIDPYKSLADRQNTGAGRQLGK